MSTHWVQGRPGPDELQDDLMGTLPQPGRDIPIDLGGGGGYGFEYVDKRARRYMEQRRGPGYATPNSSLSDKARRPQKNKPHPVMLTEITDNSRREYTVAVHSDRTQ